MLLVDFLRKYLGIPSPIVDIPFHAYRYAIEEMEGSVIHFDHCEPIIDLPYLASEDCMVGNGLYVRIFFRQGH